MFTTCLLQVLGTVLGAEHSVCSRGYVAQDFLISAKKKRRMKDSVWFSLSKFTTSMAPHACKLLQNTYYINLTF